MTDQTTEREPLIITLDLSPNPDTIRRIVEGLARASARLNEQTTRMRFRTTVANALIACLNQDDDRAAAELDGRNADQLYAIEAAGSGLAIHASRHRKRLDEAEHDDCAACGTGTTDTHGDHAAPDWRAAYDRLAAQLTAAYRERDEQRQRAEKAEAILAKAREEVAKASRAGWDVVRITTMRAALRIPDRTDNPDARRP